MVWTHWWFNHLCMWPNYLLLYAGKYLKLRYMNGLYEHILFLPFLWSSLFSLSLSLSLLVSSCSSWLLRGGVGHLVFIQPRRPRGPRGPKLLSGSSDSIDRASIQLCPGFGFWHGPVPREQNLFLFESLNNHKNREGKSGHHWLQVMHVCKLRPQMCHVIAPSLTRLEVS